MVLSVQHWPYHLVVMCPLDEKGSVRGTHIRKDALDRLRRSLDVWRSNRSSHCQWQKIYF